MAEHETIKTDEPVSQETAADTSNDTTTNKIPHEAVESDNLEDILRHDIPMEDKSALKGDYGSTIHIHQHIYHGNYVENSGTIQGGLNQQQDNSTQINNSDSTEGIEQHIQRFFRDLNTYSLAALITLATLEPIPENYFHKATQVLCDKLLTGQTEDDNSRVPAYLQTVAELVQPFAIHYQSVPITYGPDGLELKCIAYQDKLLSGQIRKQVWNNYPQLRHILLEWLLELRSLAVDATSRMMMYIAMQGMASYASFDMEYTYSYMIPFLEQHCTAQSDVKYLVTFLDRFTQWNHCRTFADDLLLRWCDARNNLLWQIPYRLYGLKGNWRFQSKVQNTLRSKLAQDCAGEGISYLKWYKADRGYFLQPAHENQTVASLLAKQMAQCFAACRRHNERYHTAIYFLTLFRWDYLTDFSKTPELVFLRCFDLDDIRKLLLPLFNFVWQYPDLRSVAQQILVCHMKEISFHCASYDYLKKPFRFLAFTSKRHDYNNTLYLLKDCAKQEDARPIANQLLDYLKLLLEERIAAYNKKKGLT